jgi:hypothetical protein
MFLVILVCIVFIKITWLLLGFDFPFFFCFEGLFRVEMQSFWVSLVGVLGLDTWQMKPLPLDNNRLT